MIPNTAHPLAATPPREPPAVHSDLEADRLEQILPQIHELARKVGGYRKLADLIRQLDRGSES
jgi:hypothetical protein